MKTARSCFRRQKCGESRLSKNAAKPTMLLQVSIGNAILAGERSHSELERNGNAESKMEENRVST